MMEFTNWTVEMFSVGGVMESADPHEPAPHPTDVIVRELGEELGILPGDIRSNLCWGLVRDRHIVQPEMIFDVHVDADVARLKAFQPPPEHLEHSELVAVRDHPSAVVGFIEQNHGELTPVAEATLLLHGLAQWGSGWFASTRGYLRGAV
jgi:8-oxo-dGTP pyrophosphatase MutT (NUDIX family)